MAELLLGGRVADWAAAKITHVRTAQAFGPHVAIGFGERGVLVAAAVFHNWRGHDIELSFAAATPRWAQRGNLRAIFSYPFQQLACVRVTVVTGRRNRRARRLAEGIGFKLEGVIRRGLDGREDAFLYGMLRSECRWLENENGKIRTDTTAPARSGRTGPGAKRRQSGSRAADGAAEPTQ